jgi:glucose/arabinose dehydrogenase
MRTQLYLLIFSILMYSMSVISQPVIKLQQVKTGFALPICIDFMQNYMYVTEQDGVIRVVDPMNNTLSAPFLDISTLVHNEGERGLLGFTFHPDYLNNGYFYVNYSRTGDFATVLARYSRSAGDPFQADPGSALILNVISQPYTNHNGGDIKFGPDGRLYITSGDGGSGGDPQNYSQNLNTQLGKILRYDVSNGTTFTIPPTNPFVGIPNTDPSIWAYGLRNAWRFNFGASGIWIADVGQSAREEINLQPSGLGGVNYGWRCYEGSITYNTDGCGSMSSYTFPVAEYNHSFGSSITGGYQYAGTEYPLLSGYYVCADYISGRFFTVHFNGTSWVGEPNEDHNDFQFATFGQDALGNMYVAGRGNGIIYKVVEFCSDYIPTAVYVDGELTIDYFGNAVVGDVSVQWYLDGNLITGANAPTFVPVVDGDYSVEVSHNIEDCILTSTELFVDVTILDLNIKDWNVKCENNNIYFDLSWFEDDQLERVVVQVSSDNKTWINVQDLETKPGQQNWSLEFPRSNESYIRIMSEEASGELSFSSVKFLNCPLEGISIFPSPAKQSFTISSLNFIQEVELFDINGKVVQSWKFNNEKGELNLDNHPHGMYIIQAKMENGFFHQTKLMIGD